MSQDIITTQEAETVAAGERFARTLLAGSIVLLYGDLGAGKTAFVRGLARGLGAAEDEVSSPTFTIIQEYSGEDLKLYHVDLYRLESKEVDDLGLDDLASDGGIVAIEWAGRWEDRPVDAIEVTLHDEGGDRRRIVVRRPDRQSVS